MLLSTDHYQIFEVKLSYVVNSKNPSRIFKTMSEIIDSLYEIDKGLLDYFSVKIEPEFLLEDILSGSLRTIVRTIVSSVDDEALKELDWKKFVGSFLVKAKHRILKMLEDKKEIISIDEVQQIEGEILEIAQETDVQRLPNYSPGSTQRFLVNISRLSNATKSLLPGDEIFYISPEGQVTINKEFNISPESIQELLTNKIVRSEVELILRVKKPDYLGQSMWDLHYEGRTIQVKILDWVWLRKFHSREIDLRPGDSLKAKVEIELWLDSDNSMVAERYIITEVLDVIPNLPSIQQKFFN
ncbi:hypothetical protein Psch_02710 [Pelotomaculum schinkii]|uniref:Uncharacterized protein n=1 Tax=Pelotomaculum schinkii TaxID=78350 RepID=A0A4Y7RAC8_9FIRM|nr:hypothetical protein [Pelotomaculum schinkii]TEB05669.1 hypothetical protein Psch_02710 [Pelotomaculum schinkii]